MDSSTAINLIKTFEDEVDRNTYNSIGGTDPGRYEERFSAWEALFVALTGRKPTAKELLVSGFTEKAIEAGLTL